MSLYLVQTVENCFSYIDNGSCHAPPPYSSPYTPGWTYNNYLITCPRHYKQTTAAAQHFWYDPADDTINAAILLTTTYWPSWDARHYKWAAATGEWLNRDSVLNRETDSWIGIWGYAYSNHSSTGSYNKLYATRNETTAIYEVHKWCLEPVAGGWSCNPNTWSPKSIYSYCIVNRDDDLFCGISSWWIDFWRGVASGNPTKYDTLRLPNTLGYLAWESRRYCWLITKDGVIGKIDYQIPRWEMLGWVQNPVSDATGFLITYDTKRKRIVVMRLRPDAADGTCQHQFEFYYPMNQAAILTDPVPIASLKTGARIPFVSHLIGDAGEGVTPYTINGELVAPVDGRLVTPFSVTEVNGRVTHLYQAPDDPAVDTLDLEVTIEENL